MTQMSKKCANCSTPLPGRANTGQRGPDIAWKCHCRACANLAGESIKILADKPGGAFITIWVCASCGTTRSCRPGWRTRCPICLDGRTSLNPCIVAALEEYLGEFPALGQLAAEAFEVPVKDTTVTQILQMNSLLTLAEHERTISRPGWTVLASDMAGMPWGAPDASRSHGTWATHDACGTVQKMTLARPECRTCPTEPGSRTHRAKSAQPQLLYLVRYLDLIKFGHGDGNRVKAHQRSGCQVIQVLRAPHEQVVAAELRIRRRYKAKAIDPSEWDLPASFGVGSEVIEDTTAIDLHDFLAGPDVLDVTHGWA